MAAQLKRKPVGPMSKLLHATAKATPLPVVAMIAACDLFEPVVCTLSIEPAVVVAVVDSVSGLPIADSARGVVQDGEFMDSLRLYSNAILSAADERPGVYQVFVERPRYQNWSAGPILVRDGDCHVQTVEFTAKLQPR